MLNLFKNKLLIPLFCVVSLLVMYDVGWTAVTYMAAPTLSKSASTESQMSGITKVLYTNTFRWDFDSAAAGLLYYADTFSTSVIIPATSLSGVTSWSAAAWIHTTGATGEFSDSIASGLGGDDTMEVVWEYSMDGSKWYTTEKVATGQTPESRNLTQTAATNIGNNFIAFGPIDRFQKTDVMDSTSALKTIDACIWPVAQYVRARLYIHGRYTCTNDISFATAIVKAFILLRKQ